MNKILVLSLTITLLYSQSVSQIEVYKKLPQAYKYYIEADYQAAIDAFKKHKETYISLYNIGFLYYLQGEHTLSLDFIKQSIKKESDFAWSYYLSALNYRKLNQAEKAITYFKLAIDEDNDQSKFFFELADTYRDQNQLAAAIENYKEGLNIKPDEAGYQVKLARLLIETKKADKQEMIKLLLETADEQYPEDDLYMLLGDLYQETGNKEKAIESYQNYFKFYPYGSFKEQIIERLNKLGISELKIPNFSKPMNYKIRYGEQLKYRVSYGLKLGEMTVIVDDKPIMLRGHEVVRVSYYLKSTSFLLSLNAVFEAFLDTKTLNTIQSTLVGIEDIEVEPIRSYLFNNEKNEFIARLIQTDGHIEFVQKELPGNTQDGTAILYYARGLVSIQKSEIVSTVIDESFKQTEVFLNNKLSEESAMGIEQPFHFLSAQAHYKGVAGMNGYAEGWFSTDGEFTPLVGKLSIIVGSVRVELVEKK